MIFLKKKKNSRLSWPSFHFHFSGNEEEKRASVRQTKRGSWFAPDAKRDEEKKKNNPLAVRGDFSRASSVQKSCLAVLNSAYLMGFRQ